MAFLRSSAVRACLAAAVSLLGCGDDGGASGTGSDNASTTTSAASSSSSSAESTTSAATGGSSGSSGGGGSGGSSEGGAGGGDVCTAGETQPCYTGPSGTEGFGLCVAGEQLCLADGSGFGACEGEVVPTAEDCITPSDDDCDGEVNEADAGCVCMPGAIAACYDGPPSTEGVGICAAGTHECSQDGLSFGACTGQVVPSPETCNTSEDDDCDGSINEEGSGCVCLPNSVTSCYTGPVGTQGVGACTPGVAACNDQGTALGSCVGDVLPALENCAATADEDCDGSSPVCTGSHNWSKRFGDANSQIGHRVAADASGNVFLAGYFTGTINLGGAPLTSAGGDDVFLAKFDAAGNHVWSKRFGNASAQIPFGLATDGSGNIVIIGQFEGSMDFGGGALTSAGALDVFLAKLDPMGNHVWSKRFGDASTQYGSDVAVDAAGNVFITGGLAGTVSFGGPPISATNLQNLFLAKLDSAGNHLWSKALGGPAELPDGTLAADPYGNVILTAWIIGALDLGGGPLPVGGSWDVLAAKFDATGNHVWSKQFGGTNDQGARAVAVDATGNVFLAGDFLNAIDFGGGVLNNPSGYDVYVAKLDPAGNHLWSKQFGGSPTNANGYGMTVDVAGNVILTGGFSGTVSFGGSPLTGAGGTDVFVAKLDAAGDHVWSYRFGDAVDQRAYDATTDGSGNILLAGIMQGTVNFGGSALTSAGGYDAFLVKLAP